MVCPFYKLPILSQCSIRRLNDYTTFENKSLSQEAHISRPSECNRVKKVVHGCALNNDKWLKAAVSGWPVSLWINILTQTAARRHSLFAIIINLGRHPQRTQPSGDILMMLHIHYSALLLIHCGDESRRRRARRCSLTCNPPLEERKLSSTHGQNARNQRKKCFVGHN